MMGKKKPQKTKELSVAIAEASSTIDDEKEQEEAQPQPQAAPRKRGRPRKVIIAKMEESEEEKAQVMEQRGGSISALGIESSMEKVTSNEKEGASSSSACMRVAKQEEMQLPKVEPSRSRARRKSKPRKSS